MIRNRMYSTVDYSRSHNMSKHGTLAYSQNSTTGSTGVTFCPPAVVHNKSTHSDDTFCTPDTDGSDDAVTAPLVKLLQFLLAFPNDSEHL